MSLGRFWDEASAVVVALCVVIIALLVLFECLSNYKICLLQRENHNSGCPCLSRGLAVGSGPHGAPPLRGSFD
jgi:hypothetical protein